MAVCPYCDGEMTEVNQCKEGIDPAASAEAIRMLQSEVGHCPDCNVAPGATHHPGCDRERCGACGDQAMACRCGHFDEDEFDDWNSVDDASPEEIARMKEEGRALAEANEAKYWAERKNNRWTGVHPGVIECHKLGWFCRDLHLDGEPATPERPVIIGRGKMHWNVPCGPDDPGASPNLNRWHQHGCPTGDKLEEMLAEGAEPNPNEMVH